ncbi:MAG: hypothetical protein JWQ96_1066 [Segetibacter sp.]|nr:hypothetical protein [Segetibacter sp.]
MKNKFTLLFFLLVLTFTAGAQTITGIWRGYFVQKTLGFYEDRYKFEVQIEQLKNNAVNGVTYSYKTTVFYGKAALTGIYTKKTNNLIINETKLMDVKIGDHSEPCLMTCYLEYHKMGNLETLTGTYSSRNLKEGGDCGTGTVYLERTTTTDFYKEEFLVKRDNAAKLKEDKKAALTAKKPVTKPVVKTPPPPPTAKIVKPGAEGALATNTPKKEITPPPVVAPKKEEPVRVPKPVEKPLPKPDVILKRGNELVKNLYISSKTIKVELYDNGEIDGDTITVYHNNRLIVSRKRLTDKPITFTVEADENDAVHEFVMVAENLGSIPPNTALMIITAGTKRYELFVTSTEQKNAVVKLEYRADSSD